MIGWKKAILALTGLYAIGAIAGQQPAAADEWYDSKPAWAVYGLGTGLLVGHLVTANHYERRDNRYYRDPYYDSYHQDRYYREPRYGPYRPDYYQPTPSSSYGDGYYHYSEKRVWPFYKRVEAEYIPPLPSPGPSNAQAVSLAEIRAYNQPAQQPVIVNVYSNDDQVRIEQGGEPMGAGYYQQPVQQPQRAVYRVVPRVTITNAAGSMFGIEHKSKQTEVPAAKETSAGETPSETTTDLVATQINPESSNTSPVVESRSEYSETDSANSGS